MYRCRVEKDSISPDGHRLTTFVIEFPRIVLAEVMTHRACRDTLGDMEMSWNERTTDETISKNSASSRAIPFSKMLEKIINDPYMPSWTLNQKGMQGGFLDDQQQIDTCNSVWTYAKNDMINRAKQLEASGVHKQDCNRLLEPWGWVTQVITSSRWDNFFALRCDKAAHPAFQKISRMMFLARRKTDPNLLDSGRWHLPFVKDEDSENFYWIPEDFDHPPEELPKLIQFSAARCAWVSYNRHEEEGTKERMLDTYGKLMGGMPLHVSPIEHQATPMVDLHQNMRARQSNLKGWLQARKLILMEEILKYDPNEEEIKSWNIDESTLWPEENQ